MGSRQPFTETNIESWTRADEYNSSYLIPPDPILESALKNSVEGGLPDISVTDVQGKFLNLLARSIGAKRILEVGTLGGYSTIWLARALPADGNLITLELSEKHAAVAAKNIENARLSDKVEIKIGPAADTIKALEANPPFDLIFIDADKVGNKTYFIEAKRLVRKGGVIIVDNVLRYGRVADPAVTNDQNVLGVRALLQHIKTDIEVEATAMGTVGSKGYDGFLYAIRL